MKLEYLFEQYKSDIEAIAKHYNVDIKKADGGVSGLKTMYDLVYEARANRSYDDTHPRWKTIARVLPYDGSKYCEFYDNECNDSHFETLLRRIKKALV